jgi:hypothetical protein
MQNTQGPQHNVDNTMPIPDDATNLGEILKRERNLQDHRPTIYRGQLSQIAEVGFLEACDNFADIGAGGGATEDSRGIDVTICHCGATERSWLKETWCSRALVENYQEILFTLAGRRNSRKN